MCGCVSVCESTSLYVSVCSLELSYYRLYQSGYQCEHVCTVPSVHILYIIWYICTRI